jgi:hypothetical protein
MRPCTAVSTAGLVGAVQERAHPGRAAPPAAAARSEGSTTTIQADHAAASWRCLGGCSWRGKPGTQHQLDCTRHHLPPRSELHAHGCSRIAPSTAPSAAGLSAAEPALFWLRCCACRRHARRAGLPSGLRVLAAAARGPARAGWQLGYSLFLPAAGSLMLRHRRPPIQTSTARARCALLSGSKGGRQLQANCQQLQPHSMGGQLSFTSRLPLREALPPQT